MEVDSRSVQDQNTDKCFISRFIKPSVETEHGSQKEEHHERIHSDFQRIEHMERVVCVEDGCGNSGA